MSRRPASADRASPDDDGSDDEAIDRRFDRYFAALRTNRDVVRCGDTFVDVPWAVKRIVACSDGLCAKAGPLRDLAGKGCCATFDVALGPGERERIAEVLPEIRALRDVGRVIDATGGWWKRQDGGESLRVRKNGACVFLSAPPGGIPRCSIHEWALSKGLDHRKLKPEICCMFPLYMVQWGDEVFVTSYGSPLMVEMDPHEEDRIESFVCINPPPGVGRPLVIEQRDEIEYRIGARRWGAMLRKLRELGHDV